MKDFQIISCIVSADLWIKLCTILAIPSEIQSLKSFLLGVHVSIKYPHTKYCDAFIFFPITRVYMLLIAPFLFFQLVDITGKDQDESMIALHDCNGDVIRAINILLEGSPDTVSSGLSLEVGKVCLVTKKETKKKNHHHCHKFCLTNEVVITKTHVLSHSPESRHSSSASELRPPPTGCLWLGYPGVLLGPHDSFHIKRV